MHTWIYSSEMCYFQHVFQMRFFHSPNPFENLSVIRLAKQDNKRDANTKQNMTFFHWIVKKHFWSHTSLLELTYIKLDLGGLFGFCGGLFLVWVFWGWGWLWLGFCLISVFCIMPCFHKQDELEDTNTQRYNGTSVFKLLFTTIKKRH